MTFIRTPSQTIGPYFSVGLSHLCSCSTYDQGAEGLPVTICGSIFDGNGVPIPDAQLEFWNADSHGIYAEVSASTGQALNSKFRGFARIATNNQGGYALHTILPGRTPGPRGSLQAPHIVVLVFFRGVLRQLLTRIYFLGEASNEEDSVLCTVPYNRRHTLIARPIGDQANIYLWDIHMQGDEETVFFSC